MKQFFWKTILIISISVSFVSTATIKKQEPESTTESEKLLKKRQTLITLDHVTTCNLSRQTCISMCRNQYDCIEKCPICPTIEVTPGNRHIIVEGVNDTFVYKTPLSPGHNVTTVIKLVNLVNNTNVIDIPTNVNLTNQNNIHVYQNDTAEEGGDFGMGYNRFGSCCIVVQPRTCVRTSKGYSCHHKRHKTCGQRCTARIIHADTRRRCSGGSCAHKTSYIPQPKKPRCVYTPEWPFVSCGGHRRQNCAGCYQHYGYGAHSYYGGYRNVPQRCYTCYDDAFNVGPLYRRGPVLRPFHYHQPPCYVTGTCYQQQCGMFGCFGNEFMDPSWGFRGYPQMGMPPMMNPYPMMPPRSPHHHRMARPHFVPTISETTENNTNLDYLEIDGQMYAIPSDGADFGVESEKCRVVDNNGTITIKNCTETEFRRNVYAGSPEVLLPRPVHRNEVVDDLDYDDDDLDDYEDGNDPSMYEGFNRAPWDLDDQADPNRNLRRRHAKNSRTHQIVYDDDDDNNEHDNNIK